MQRYTPYVDYENLHDDENDVTVLPQDDGAWVLYSEARAEIELLEKEVDRLLAELTASCARAELQQREAERIRRDNGVLHDAIEKIFEEGAKQLARADTAWNDAIEAAYAASEQYPLDDITSTERDAFISGCMSARAAIRALKRSQE